MEKLPIWSETFRIPAFEGDFQQHWKASCIFQKLTDTAGEHAAHLGFDNPGMLATGKVWVLSRMKVRMDQALLVGQQVTLRTWPRDIVQKLFFRREFELFAGDGSQLGAATSYWTLIDTQTRRLLKPEALGGSLIGTPDRRALEETLEKINPPEGMPVRHTARAGYSTIDLLGHVNNARYVDWITDCFSLEEHRGRSIAWIQVNYASEVQPGEQVSIAAAPAPDDAQRWLFEGRHPDNTRAFEAALGWRE